MRVLILAALVVAAVAVDPARLAMIERINAGKHSWTAGLNAKFAEAPLGESRKLCGVLEGGVELPVKEIEVANSLPASFDPRDKWSKCKSLDVIRDQGPCGSCWAHGAAEAATDRLCIHSDGAHQEPLSAEDLMTCCYIVCGQGCNGGYPSSAWSFINTIGLVTGNKHEDTQWCSPYAWPFCDHHMNGTYPPCPDLQPTPKCSTTCVNGKDYSSDKHKFNAPYSVPAANVEAIKTELMTNGPIEVAFTVYEDFEQYKTGVYVHKEGEVLGGHAVKMMGWGTSEEGMDYWLIANSWNTDWGEEGFFRIRLGTDECGIESSGVAGMPKL
jgi:cathepsin B